ncbi:hypothetical protein GDO78_021985 [Eleutherodactylus coqui]|uniref:Uncharacterized protein n=1 Tax=Eleutherodactylus coqui TaxID=57060 RepID=A0A8J6AZS6_ELECQ|nr:hypothetical protein GDO78_021985 [Eleutherodactylus coqui]
MVDNLEMLHLSNRSTRSVTVNLYIWPAWRSSRQAHQFNLDYFSAYYTSCTIPTHLPNHRLNQATTWVTSTTQRKYFLAKTFARTQIYQ